MTWTQRSHPDVKYEKKTFSGLLKPSITWEIDACDKYSAEPRDNREDRRLKNTNLIIRTESFLILFTKNFTDPAPRCFPNTFHTINILITADSDIYWLRINNQWKLWFQTLYSFLFYVLLVWPLTAECYKLQSTSFERLVKFCWWKETGNQVLLRNLSSSRFVRWAQKNQRRKVDLTFVRQIYFFVYSNNCLIFFILY